MASRIMFGLVMLIMMGFSLVALAPQLGVGGEREIDPGVVLRVQGADVSVRPEPWQLSAKVAARARELASSHAPIQAGSLPGGYAVDYRGLVGYTWELPLTGELADPDLWASELRAHYAVEIPYAMLQPGDILVNLRTGVYGHALVFDHWEDARLVHIRDVTDQSAVRQALEQGVRFASYEIDSQTSPQHVATRTYTLRVMNGAITIQELEQRLHGPYFALRSNRIPGYVSTVNGVRATSQVQVGQPVSTRMVLVNRGGAPVALNKITAIVYGPNALQQGVAANAVLYPEVNAVVLMPGQTYEYTQAGSLARPGSYLILPRFEVNGEMYLPLEPTYVQILPS